MNPNISEVVLHAASLVKSYNTAQGIFKALDCVDFQARSGEVTLVVGPSGSGKSTLLEVISGLRKPDGGVVQLLGKNIWSFRRPELDACRMQHCGYVFQEFNLFPALTALEQIVIVLKYMGMNSKIAKLRAIECLSEVGLSDKMDSKPATLSGGQKQRVAIARALAKNPKIIFADEPTSALDHENGLKVGSLLKRIAKEHNTAVVVVSHDAEFTQFADIVVSMESGKSVKSLRRA